MIELPGDQEKYYNFLATKKLCLPFCFQRLGAVPSGTRLAARADGVADPTGRRGGLPALLPIPLPDAGSVGGDVALAHQPARRAPAGFPHVALSLSYL